MTVVDADELRILVRLHTPDEHNMILSNWKQELNEERLRRGWGRGLREQDYWLLINYVLDRITLPSSLIYVGTHPDTPYTPLLWMAVRDGVMLYSYAKRLIRADRAMAEAVESAMLRKLPVTAIRIHDFDPFRELERAAA